MFKYVCEPLRYYKCCVIVSQAAVYVPLGTAIRPVMTAIESGTQSYDYPSLKQPVILTRVPHQWQIDPRVEGRENSVDLQGSSCSQRPKTHDSRSFVRLSNQPAEVTQVTTPTCNGVRSGSAAKQPTLRYTSAVVSPRRSGGSRLENNMRHRRSGFADCMFDETSRSSV
jgi:hypothetical protein